MEHASHCVNQVIRRVKGGSVGVAKAQERQQKRSDQLDEFEETGAQLSAKVVSVQDGKKEINANIVEHPLK